VIDEVVGQAAGGDADGAFPVVRVADEGGEPGGQQALPAGEEDVVVVAQVHPVAEEEDEPTAVGDEAGEALGQRLRDARHVGERHDGVLGESHALHFFQGADIGGDEKRRVGVVEVHRREGEAQVVALALEGAGPRVAVHDEDANLVVHEEAVEAGVVGRQPVGGARHDHGPDAVGAGARDAEAEDDALPAAGLQARDHLLIDDAVVQPEVHREGFDGLPAEVAHRGADGAGGVDAGEDVAGGVVGAGEVGPADGGDGEVLGAGGGERFDGDGGLACHLGEEVGER